MKGQSGTSGRVVCSLHGAGGANSRALGIIIIFFKLREQLLKTKLNKQTKTRLLTFTNTSPSWETPRQIFPPLLLIAPVGLLMLPETDGSGLSAAPSLSLLVRVN